MTRPSVGSVQARERLATPMKSVTEVLERILSVIEPISAQESVSLRESLGRVLARTLTTPHPLPPHRSSAMDGYALNSASLAAGVPVTLPVVGSSLAGEPYWAEVAAGECVRINTGALVPDGADRIIIREDVSEEASAIRITTVPSNARHIREAGEDIPESGGLLERGRVLGAADIGLLAAAGVVEVPVHARVTVGFFSTGTELTGLGQPLEPGQIYDSNRYTLFGLLRELGCAPVDLGRVPDRQAELEDVLRKGTQHCHAIISSGGVSVGQADLVLDTVAQLGEVSLWRVAMKPGKPFLFGRINQTWMFGLPGNPVSVMATFYQLVQPALRALSGATPRRGLVLRATLTEPLRKSPGRTDYQRGIVENGPDGQLLVRGTGPQGSHMLSSMSRANCFIVLPAHSGDVAAGTTVDVQPFALI